MNYSQTAAFRSAGYQDIQVNSSYVAGQVRQHGNYSFSRVYQAGHEIPSYQPEAAYQIFQRAIFGLDIATGTVHTETKSDYSTKGPLSSFHIKNDVPPSPAPVCYILDFFATCTDESYYAVMDGTALIKDYIVIDKNSSSLFPELHTGNNGSGNAYPSGSGGDNQSIPSGTTTAPGSQYTGGAGKRSRGVGMAAGGLMLGALGMAFL